MSLLARSCYTKQVVINRHSLKPGNISRKLQKEGIKASGRGIAKFLAKFIESASVARKPGSGRPSKRNGRCNEMDRGTDGATKWTMERKETDRFTPFLGKRCHHATQTDRTVFRTFFRRVPYMHVKGDKT